MPLSDQQNIELKVTQIDCQFPKGTAFGETMSIWRDWCGGQKAPQWKDVDLPALPPTLLPNTLVVDVIDDGADFVYRFWGSGYTTNYGVDETRSKLSETTGPAFIGATKQQLKAVIAAQTPLSFEVEIIAPPLGIVQIKQNLRLPIMDEPETVTKILTVSTFEKADHRKIAQMHDAIDRDISRRTSESE